jgi:hypothetical protein
VHDWLLAGELAICGECGGFYIGEYLSSKEWLYTNISLSDIHYTNISRKSYKP